MSTNSNVGFIVTFDHLDSKAICVVGPNGVSDELMARLKAGEGDEFRMYDDDDELYYSGRCINNEGDDMFLPLDCYGTPNAGATTIQYKINGKWEVI